MNQMMRIFFVSQNILMGDFYMKELAQGKNEMVRKDRDVDYWSDKNNLVLDVEARGKFQGLLAKYEGRFLLANALYN